MSKRSSPRTVSRVRIVDPDSGEKADEALAAALKGKNAPNPINTELTKHLASKKEMRRVLQEQKTVNEATNVELLAEMKKPAPKKLPKGYVTPPLRLAANIQALTTLNSSIQALDTEIASLEHGSDSDSNDELSEEIVTEPASKVNTKEKSKSKATTFKREKDDSDDESSYRSRGAAKLPVLSETSLLMHSQLAHFKNKLESLMLQRVCRKSSAVPKQIIAAFVDGLNSSSRLADFNQILLEASNNLTFQHLFDFIVTLEKSQPISERDQFKADRMSGSESCEDFLARLRGYRQPEIDTCDQLIMGCNLSQAEKTQISILRLGASGKSPREQTDLILRYLASEIFAPNIDRGASARLFPLVSEQPKRESCRNYASGTCRRGQDCPRLHDMPSRTFSSQRQPNSRFSAPQQRPPQSSFAVSAQRSNFSSNAQSSRGQCFNFTSGSCHFGDNCRYSHGPINQAPASFQQQQRSNPNSKSCFRFARGQACQTPCRFSHDSPTNSNALIHPSRQQRIHLLDNAVASPSQKRARFVPDVSAASISDQAKRSADIFMVIESDHEQNHFHMEGNQVDHSPVLMVKLLIGGILLDSLCDTGSSGSFVGSGVFANLLQRDVLQPLPPKFMKIVTGNGVLSGSLDRFQATVSAPNTDDSVLLSFGVLPALEATSVILGMNFMRIAAVVIDLRSNLLQFNSFRDFANNPITVGATRSNTEESRSAVTDALALQHEIEISPDSSRVLSIDFSNSCMTQAEDSLWMMNFNPQPRRRSFAQIELIDDAAVAQEPRRRIPSNQLFAPLPNQTFEAASLPDIFADMPRLLPASDSDVESDVDMPSLRPAVVVHRDILLSDRFEQISNPADSCDDDFQTFANGKRAHKPSSAPMRNSKQPRAGVIDDEAEFMQIRFEDGQILEVSISEEDKNSPPPPPRIPKATGPILGDPSFSASQMKLIHDAVEQSMMLLPFPPDFPKSTSLVKFEIKLIPGAVPPSLPPYRTSPAKQEKIDRCVDKDIARGHAEPYFGPNASPVVLIEAPADAPPGKDDRLAKDYRYINSATIPSTYPIPTADSILSRLHGAKFFTKLDLEAAFHQIAFASEEDMNRAAYITCRGTYRPTVMEFGLRNAPSYLQKAMDILLREFKCVEAYLDDIIIWDGKTLEEHLLCVVKVLLHIRKNSLRVKPSKCLIAQIELPFIGFLISEKGIRPDPKNVVALSKFPEPNNTSLPIAKRKKIIQSFLGFCSFYRRMIPNFANKERPLRQLLINDAPWSWTSECQSALDLLKSEIVNSVTLHFPDFSRQFIIVTDASSFGIGAYLSQLVDGVERPISFASRQLSRAEKAYHATFLEALAVIFACRVFHNYIAGTEFILESDHIALAYIL